MFYAKMHDDEDDELPRYEEEEEGLEQPHEGEAIEEVEEVIVDAESGEDEAEESAHAPAPRKAAPAKKAQKPTAKKKAKPKKKVAKAKKAAKAKPAKKGGKKKKR